ncbi:LysR family transcriptional regulator [Nocardiopsis dassonvillei]|uniref:LysR family transcriptional regulator n=1 Tax=Nocardiopsis dassonvillei TaxID=2014 RepID=UPI0033EA5BDC
MAREIDFHEIECFLVLAEELHFGRTGERLRISQSRVSQLIRSLEGRVGARLVERTSRRVRLSEFGADFLESLRPSYGALVSVFEDARSRARSTVERVRIGFQGAVYEPLAQALTLFERRNPLVAVDLVEIPLADPFGAVREGRVDAAVVLTPVREPDLTLGLAFSRQPQTLALSSSHPFAGREEIGAEELARVRLVPLAGRAPAYWRQVNSPRVTPGGARIPQEGGAVTLQEGLSLVAAGRGALLVCGATAEYNRRPDVTYVPVTGLAESELGLVWRTAARGSRLTAFAAVLAETVA